MKKRTKTRRKENMKECKNRRQTKKRKQFKQTPSLG